MLKRVTIVIVFIFSVFLMFLSSGNLDLFKNKQRYHTKDKSGEVILRIMYDGEVMDCSDCHEEQEVDMTQRELGFHEEIKYQHITGSKWCFHCHYDQPGKRGKIKLETGKYTGTHKLHLLCGQCHGKKLSEWKSGIHGKQIGSWMASKYGENKKLNCGDCHSPHHPRSFRVKPFRGPLTRFEGKGGNE
jgi:hypothetical protein